MCKRQQKDRLIQVGMDFSNCSLLDAVVSAAASMPWLNTDCRYVTVSRYHPSQDPPCTHVTRVWNSWDWLDRFEDLADQGLQLPLAKFVGHFAIDAGPLSEDVEDRIRLVLELPA